MVQPKRPTITKIYAGDPDSIRLGSGVPGDKKITIVWTSNREPGLQEYRIYRINNAELAKDIRLMTLVHRVIGPFAGSNDRPAEVTWTDNSVQAMTNYYYRLEAIERVNGDVDISSEPSEPVSALAFDDIRPSPPIWNQPIFDRTSNTVTLSWIASAEILSCLVQRKTLGSLVWESVSRWLQHSVTSYTDSTRIRGLTYDYRLIVKNTEGKSNNNYSIVSI